jgi:hypothetical protein
VGDRRLNVFKEVVGSLPDVPYQFVSLADLNRPVIPSGSGMESVMEDFPVPFPFVSVGHECDTEVDAVADDICMRTMETTVARRGS